VQRQVVLALWRCGATGRPTGLLYQNSLGITRLWNYDDNNPNPWTQTFEPEDTKIDWAETVFDTNSTKVSKADYKYEKMTDYPLPCPMLPPGPEGPLRQTISVDPLLGLRRKRFLIRCNSLCY